MALKFRDCWVLIHEADGELEVWALPTQAECWNILIKHVDDQWSLVFDEEEVKPIDARERVVMYYDANGRERFHILRSR